VASSYLIYLCITSIKPPLFRSRFISTPYPRVSSWHGFGLPQSFSTVMRNNCGKSESRRKRNTRFPPSGDFSPCWLIKIGFSVLSHYPGCYVKHHTHFVVASVILQFNSFRVSVNQIAFRDDVRIHIYVSTYLRRRIIFQIRDVSIKWDITHKIIFS